MKRASIVCAVLLTVLAAAPASAQFGGILDKAGKAAQTGKKLKDLNISEEDERQIGERVSTQIRQRYGVVQDKAVHRYVSLVGAVLAQASSRPGLNWQFIVLDTDGVNAFAAPGGLVHITRGALALMSNESELAGVLGHEITHVTEKHTINSIRNSAMKDVGVDMAPGGGLAKAALDKLGDAAYKLVYAGYNRGEELESDEKGIVLVNKIWYAPQGLPNFLTRLSDRNTNATQKAGLFASHPEMQERLDKLRKQIETQKLTASAVLPERYKKFIAYVPKPQAEIAQVQAGSAGLAGGSSEPAKKDDAAKKDDSANKEKAKTKGFGLGSLMKPAGEEKKSAQVTGSGGARGIDPERNAKGGSNPNIVVVALTAGDLSSFKKDGKLN